MGATRTQKDWEPLWRTGHCLLGSLTASTGEWRDSKNNVVKPARQLVFPRPIPPSFSVQPYLLELASGVWVLECGVLTAREV